MKLKLTNEQKLILSQKMQQSLKLLQMNSHELETYLNELSMENPLIEAVCICSNVRNSDAYHLHRVP